MKNCKNCEKEIQDNYTYCLSCMTEWKQKNTTTTTKNVGSWHDDPMIDVLMKINANLGKIHQALLLKREEEQ